MKKLLSSAKEEVESFIKEMAILRACHDPHVVQFLGACLEEVIRLNTSSFWLSACSTSITPFYVCTQQIQST